MAKSTKININTETQTCGGTIMNRGRPKLTMTLRRKQVLAAYEAEARDGVCPSLSRLARRVGLYDYREARRVMGDLREMGMVAR